ncbi:hypothetical protein BC834DRAFT_825003 [Gloeopeniophorella convolvens]|nr:hypothetical protein BC834DRAFT_825003 [Gloeopeniophorella convolvens]
MVLTRTPALRLTSRRARSVTSYLFGATFFACILAVSASDILPCPAHLQRGRFADGESEGPHPSNRRVTVEKRPRRWIEERHPGSCDT